ncbi:3-mercaptopyruvate sulfurtransferase [Geodia barretti]|uniref:3-mercaptopyruvate sulfurtransferase n=1 Tax=Geodia barretti TaxID=519541 RepID=A0AA35WW26_GEOBA|nr:3-mercaptopyruvate sulfurtransferase [Geodia barretti]
MLGEGRAAFLGERLAGAQHFDIDEVSEQSSPYPHMIPSPHRFQTSWPRLAWEIEKIIMGVGNGDHVVVYDGHSEGLMASARVWWMFRVVDARSNARFRGEVPEPRPSLPSGGMKGAVNIHYSSLLDAQWECREFQRSGVDLTQPVVATCGSGVTAAIIALAAHSLNTTIPLYDGSWSEWRQRAPLQTVTTGVTQLPHNTAS